MATADLYGLPLEEFTPARDALVKELRSGGKKEAAEEVRALRKPPVSVWAVNQAARRRPDVARALVKAGAELRKAQRGAVSGRGEGGLREATRAHRRLVDELTEAAHDVLDERGGVSTSALASVAQTLRGASIDKEASKGLASGTLAGEVEQAGFGPLLSAVPKRAAQAKPAHKPEPKPKPRSGPKPKPKPKSKPKPDPNVARRAKLEKEIEKARARVRELEERLDGLSGG